MERQGRPGVGEEGPSWAVPSCPRGVGMSTGAREGGAPKGPVKHCGGRGSPAALRGRRPPSRPRLLRSQSAQVPAGGARNQLLQGTGSTCGLKLWLLLAVAASGAL